MKNFRTKACLLQTFYGPKSVPTKEMTLLFKNELNWDFFESEK